MNSYYVSITSHPIELGQIHPYLEHSSHGAQIWFYGVVRDLNHERKVLAVSYESFAPLAEKTFQEICEEVKYKWGGSYRSVIVHRVGKLAVGETSVAIGVSLPHRDEAYQASRYMIEQLKTRAPIWKKEHYEDGESDWLEGHCLCEKAGMGA